MSNLQDLQNRYNEGDKMTSLEMLVIIAQDETAADELVALNKIADVEPRQIELPEMYNSVHTELVKP